MRRRRRPRWLALRQLRTALVATAAAISIWVIGHIYYYNQLIALEQNVEKAWAQVEAAQVRRAHVGKSTAQIVKFYARHERDLMMAITELRALKKQGDNKAVGPPGTVDGIAAVETPALQGARPDLEGLQLVAEQYPQLALTPNTTAWQASVIASEIEIMQRTSDYNNAVNAYTTVLSQFPARLFATVLGFKPAKLYNPEKDDTTYREPNL
jgi:LemA protein